ncbi:mechanosensitive ion channel family protein [Massilia sp. CF038]|uniref:mechanosensitive ion channel family protein n=1 Tax=Massilia sp. CF038 TaxID=1881045 RepID=UPI00090FC941|nr:mechanosensitive ion channel family protein [Massilia sp. CF038]SHG63366.1 Small-conductance mechanosensitive channel [Massilia sp. CF038]
MLARLPIRTYLPPVNIDLANAALALGAAIASFILLKLCLVFIRRKLCQLSEDQAGHAWAQILKKTLGSTSTIALAATSLLIGLALLDLPAPWNERVKHLWFIGLGVQIALYLHRGIAVATKSYFARHASTRGESETVAHTLIIWALQTAVWIIFSLALLANLGINVSTFIASLGIGGIAIALAVQNILGDLFASLAIAVDKPFEVGDSISVTGFSGTVEHVGLKTTRVRSDSGEQVVISNTELLKSTVRNFKRMSRRRVQFSLFASPATPAALAAKVPPEMRRIVEAQTQVKFDRAHLKNFNQSAVEFDIVYYVLDSGYALFMDTQQAVLLEAMAALERLGISTSTAQSHVVVESEQPLRRVGMKAV